MSLLCVCPRVKTGHSTQHRKFESLKIINSRDDEIRFEFNELNAKRAKTFELVFAGIVLPGSRRDGISPCASEDLSCLRG